MPQLGAFLARLAELCRSQKIHLPSLTYSPSPMCTDLLVRGRAKPSPRHSAAELSHMGKFFICPWLLIFSKILNNERVWYLQNVTCENDFFFSNPLVSQIFVLLSKFGNRRGRLSIKINWNILDAQSCWNFGRSNLVELENSSTFSNLLSLLCVHWSHVRGRAKLYCRTLLQSQATFENLSSVHDLRTFYHIWVIHVSIWIT